MGTSKATKGHGIEPLPREAGIANAVEAIDAGAVERHRQQAGQPQRWDRAIAALVTAKEAAMAARGPHFAVMDAATEARQEQGLEALD